MTEERVASVNHDVAGREQGCQLLDHLVYSFARLHDQQDAARRLERLHELFERPRADPMPARASALDERLHLALGVRSERHCVAVLLDVEREVLAHDSEADES